MDRSIIHNDVTSLKSFIKIHYTKKLVHKLDKMSSSRAFWCWLIIGRIVVNFWILCTSLGCGSLLSIISFFFFLLQPVFFSLGGGFLMTT
ncbi:uncharacterized protein RHIMIDRAFT_52207 [Rhizopus microsporus ATCC 52813]|uniref:Uncharacterized protein n=1 Tax=Rhizopus microsporus ATCC 52813 TaxID=1340429 RepID=A0A2G4SJX8_RHIZD|nr:uncharacterized protein RHIMIDRAFT_52207 [Rhizopus microsporus ATCC 52813]PHZ09074.1 hypothetical protein RHIMIDRAFT_52207 [Rhizopus microsporus ATCC 52813]